MMGAAGDNEGATTGFVSTFADEDNPDVGLARNLVMGLSLILVFRSASLHKKG
jgi:hypothetical protein